MIKIREIALTPPETPKVVLSVTSDEPELVSVRQSGAHILETRIDGLKSLSPIDVINEVRALAIHGLPLVGTIRGKNEGGIQDITDNARIELYQKISPLVNAIDIEMASEEVFKEVEPVIRKNRNTLILSFHDFEKTPSMDDLETVLDRGLSNHADIVKIAVTAKNHADVSRLAEFTIANKSKNIATISLGPVGTLSRLFFPTLGSLLTYTGIKPNYGQIPFSKFIAELRLLYPEFNQEFIKKNQDLEYA